MANERNSASLSVSIQEGGNVCCGISMRHSFSYQQPPIQRLVAKGVDTNEDETLFEEDLVVDVVEDKQKVYAIMQ